MFLFSHIIIIIMIMIMIMMQVSEAGVSSVSNASVSSKPDVYSADIRVTFIINQKRVCVRMCMHTHTLFFYHRIKHCRDV